MHVPKLVHAWINKSIFLLFACVEFFFGCFRLFKIKYHAVDTIAQAGWGRTIFENMAEVAFAAAAFHFRANHAIRIIGQINNRCFTDGLVETWPSTAAFEFGIAFKQGVAAYRAERRHALLQLIVSSRLSRGPSAQRAE